MASSVTEAEPRESAEFVESSVLEAIVPSDSSIDLDEELSSWAGDIEDENLSILPSITQRQTLFFGKILISHANMSKPHLYAGI